MIYKSNEDIKKEIKKILLDLDMTQTDVAKMLNMSRQQFNNTFNKANLSFDDINKICNAIGYNLEINIVKNESKLGKLSSSKIG